MNNIQIFRSNEFGHVRVIIINDVPWFVGTDVASILKYSNCYGALNRHVDSEDKQVIQNSRFESFAEETFDIPPRGLVVINESGLYSLILRSKLEAAKRFKSWVTSTVLPSIRKTGEYRIDNVVEQSGNYRNVESEDVYVENDEVTLAKATLILKRIVAEKTELLKHSEAIIYEKDRIIEEQDKTIYEKDKVLEEKEMFINQISKSKNSIKVRDLAQLCCKNGIIIGQNRLFEQLRIWGLLCRSDNSPYQRYVDRGLFEIVEFPLETSRGVEIKRSLRITGKGQEYIVVRLLKERMRVSKRY